MHLRAITIRDRGESQDFEDFIDLMKLALAKGIQFGLLNQDEMGRILSAAKKAGRLYWCLPKLDNPHVCSLGLAREFTRTPQIRE